MTFSLDQYGDAMRAVKLPPTADDVRKARDRFLDAREAVTAAESDIHAAAGKRGANLEALYQRLEMAKDGLLEAQRQFEQIGQYGLALEAKERADKVEANQKAARHKAQATHAIEEEARTKDGFQERWLAAGGTLEQFQKAWGGPDGLWDQELRRRVTESGHAPDDILRATGRYAV